MLKKLVDCPFGDYIIYVVTSQRGLIKFIPKRMGVYRMHSSGNWSTLDYNKALDKTVLVYRLLFAQLSKEQGDMLKIRYLKMLEVYLLQDDLKYDDEKFKKLLIQEMCIDPYILLYLKQNCEERKKVFYYSSRIPFSILIKSLQKKILNRFN